MLTVVRQIGHPGVGDGIHHGADAPDHRHHQGSLQEELRQGGVGIGGNEEGEQVSGDDAVDHAPGKITHAQCHDPSVGQRFHGSASLYFLSVNIFIIQELP